MICNALRTKERSMIQDKTDWVKHSQSSPLLVFPDTESTLHAFFYKNNFIRTTRHKFGQKFKNKLRNIEAWLQMQIIANYVQK